MNEIIKAIAVTGLILVLVHKLFAIKSNSTEPLAGVQSSLTANSKFIAQAGYRTSRINWSRYIKSGQIFSVVFNKTKSKFTDVIYSGSWQTDPMGSLKGGETYTVRYIPRISCKANCSEGFYKYGFEVTGYNQGANKYTTFSYFNAELDKKQISLWGRLYIFSSNGEVFDLDYGLVGHLEIAKKPGR